MQLCLSSECVSTSVVDIRPCPNGRNGEVCSGQGVSTYMCSLYVKVCVASDNSCQNTVVNW